MEGCAWKCQAAWMSDGTAPGSGLGEGPQTTNLGRGQNHKPAAGGAQQHEPGWGVVETYRCTENGSPTSSMLPAPCAGKARRGTARRMGRPDGGAGGVAAVDAMDAGAAAEGAAEGSRDRCTPIAASTADADEATGATSIAPASDLAGRTMDQTAPAIPKEAMAAAIHTHLRPCLGGSGASLSVSWTLSDS